MKQTGQQRRRHAACFLMLAALLACGIGPVLAEGGTAAAVPAAASQAMPATAATPATPSAAPATPAATAPAPAPSEQAPATTPSTAATAPVPAAPSINNPAGANGAGNRIGAAPAATSSAASAAVASAGSLTQVALVLLLVVGLIAGAAWLMKRLGMARGAGGTTIRVVSGVSLSNRERILVVEIADQWIVVGVAPGCINTLATLPRQAQAVDAAGMQPPSGKNFALWLKQTIDRRNAPGVGNTDGH